MRLFAIPFLIVASASPQQLRLATLTPALKVVTDRPRVDGPTVLKLGDGAAAEGVAWDFGDGSSWSGGATATHRFGAPGTFTVKATRNGGTAQAQVVVVEPRRLVVSPETLLPGQAATLRLEEAFASTLHWSFGDGSPEQAGPAQVSHTFPKAGTYTVTVRDLLQDSPRTFTQSVGVGLQGAGAPFSLSYVALRWEDGTADRSVTAGTQGLVAYADLKFEGTGQLQAQWVVDGQVQRSVSQTLGFAKTATLGSGRLGLVAPREGSKVTLASTVPGEYQISLPTNVPGEHTVTLKVSQPKLAFQVPVIRYFVKLAGAPQGPTVTGVSPASARPGEEVELTLSGSGFTSDMTLNLGKDLSAVGPVRVLSPDKALVKVFLAPTAAAGPRPLQSQRSGSGPSGSARLEVLPRAALSRVIPPQVSPAQPPTQPMSGTLPGGKPLDLKAPAGLVKVEEGRGKPPAALSQALKPEEKPLARVGELKPPVGLAKVEGAKPDLRGGLAKVVLPPKTAPAVDLSRLSRETPGRAQFASGVKAVVDAKTAARKEKVIACVEGQRLKLGDISLKEPSFELIGVNAHGEFQKNYVPLLRDTTQFTWSEKNPGTAEFFELRFFDAQDGALLKTVKVNGGTYTYNVTPGFLQELGRVEDAHALQGNLSTFHPSPSKSGFVSVKPSEPAKSGAAVKPSTDLKPGALAGGAPKAGLGTLGLAPVKPSAPLPTQGIGVQGLDIPAAMQKNAHIVWQVVGFRSFPCVAPEELAAQVEAVGFQREAGFTKLTPATGKEASGASKPLDLKPTGTLKPSDIAAVLGDKPVATKPMAGTAQPSAAQPSAAQPSAAQPSAAQPNAAQPNAAQPKSTTPVMPSLQPQGNRAGTGALPTATDQQTKGQPKVYQSVVAEVSRSVVWPLRNPATAQGVSPGVCTVGTAASKSVVLQANKKANDGAKGPGGTNIAEAKYVFDEIRLFGTFDLGQNVPYKLLPGSVLAPGALQFTGSMAKAGGGGSGFGSLVSSVTDATAPATGGSNSQGSLIQGMNFVSFKNVFVDWGDGTLEHFRGRPETTMYSGSELNGRYFVDNGSFKHAYQRASKYLVKVFVLSDEDMVRSGLEGDVAKALTPSEGFAGAFHRLNGATLAVRPGLASSTPSPTRPGRAEAKPTLAPTAPAASYLQGPPNAAQALARAYVLYCQELTIDERRDPCANGPLHLVSTTLEFPKEAAGARTLLPTAKEPIRGMAPAKPGLTAAAAPKPSLAVQGGPSVSAGGAQPSLPGGGVASMNPGALAGAASLAPVPTTTPCNLFYSAVTRVKYYGMGQVRVVWKVDGKQVGSREAALKSAERKGLTEATSQVCRDPLLGELVLNSPALPVDALGRHKVTVEAFVLPSKSADLTELDLQHLVGLSQGQALERAPSPRLAHTLVDALGGGARPKVSLGLLNPNQASGQPAFVSLNQVAGLARSGGFSRQASGALVGALQQRPPYRVETEATYEVKAAEDGKVCNLFFPVKGGLVPVTNLGSTLSLKPEGTLARASGKGLLVLNLRAGTAPDAIAPYPVDIAFSDWMVDGVTVSQGAFALSPEQAYDGPGVKGKVKRVEATVKDKNAPEDLKATLELQPVDSSIVLVKDSKTPPKWSGSAALSPEGDWLLSGLTLPESKLGPTPWNFSATDVTIDLSAKQGADPKGGKSPEWTGVHLGSVTVTPTTLGATGGTWAKALPQPKDWTLEGLGVVGKLDTGAWQVEYLKGKLSIGNIAFEGKRDGTYRATYKNVVVQTPWFKQPITGDAKWVRMDNGEYRVNVDQLHADKRPTLAGGPMAIEPMDLQLTQIKEGGLLPQGRARLTLKAEGKPLTTFEVDRVGFGLNGQLYFGDDGARSATAVLNQQSSLGQTPAELKTAVLTGNADAASPLTVRVNGQLRLTENAVIPPAPVTMDYTLKAGQGVADFTAPEVKVSPFSLDVGFPIGSPAMNAKINTQHQNSGGASGNVPNLPGVRFTGDVDLALFGGNPVKAQFVLGYENKQSYFATRVDVPLGPSGVVLYPEIVSLYRLSGGFAYNFGSSVFTESTSITSAKPDFKGETLFMAGVRLGSADQFIYTLDGMVTIKSSGTPRIDFGAWLLERNPSGTAPLRGMIQYANGALDGRIWGGFKFLGGVAEIDLGPSEQAAACSLHVGGGAWHIYAGQRDGQRIVGRLMGSQTSSYLMLGSEVGLAVGGSSEWYMGVGSGNVGSAYAKGWMDMGLQITPQPKVIGNFGAGLRAGACALGACVSAGVSANVHAEALPVSLSASCCLDLPWPLGDICFSVRM